MRLLPKVLFICLLLVYGSCTLEARGETRIILYGKGTIKAGQDVERMHVEGTASGYISGTFVWRERHELAPEPGEAVEQGTIVITDQNGDTITLSFTGRATLEEGEEAILEGAKGRFTFVEGTGRWAERSLSGTFSKAGVWRGETIELSITLMVEGG